MFTIPFIEPSKVGYKGARVELSEVPEALSSGETSEVEGFVELPPEIAGEKIVNVLLESGKVPDWLIYRRPGWMAKEVKEPEKLQKQVDALHPNVVQPLSEYYQRLEDSLTEKEKAALDLMKSRLDREAIGTVSIDMVPLLAEDTGDIPNAFPGKTSWAEVNSLTGKELANMLFFFLGGHNTLERFGKSGIEGTPFEGVLKPVYYGGPSAQPGAPLVKVNTGLSKKQLIKRIFFGMEEFPRDEYLERKKIADERRAEKLEMKAEIPPDLLPFYKKDWSKRDIDEIERAVGRYTPEQLQATIDVYKLKQENNELTSYEGLILESLKEMMDEIEMIAEQVRAEQQAEWRRIAEAAPDFSTIIADNKEEYDRLLKEWDSLPDVEKQVRVIELMASKGAGAKPKERPQLL